MITPSEIVIPDKDPFENDVLARKESIDKLTALLTQVSGPFVLGLNSPWGTGKTTFVRMWERHLKNSGFKTLYFNAWETDFADDPFLVLVQELRGAIRDLDGCDSKIIQTAGDKFKKASIAVAKKGLPIAIRIATSGLLNIDEKSEGQISKLVSEIAKERLDEYEQRKRSLRGFRETLEDLVKTLAEDEEIAKPLVVFVDELDRCRPTYAIELLENAKHLFSVSGIVFVISIDRKQLACSIKSVYGSEFDSEGYLRRFFDLDFVLPDPQGYDFVDYLFESMGINNYFESLEPRDSNDPRERLYETMARILPSLRLGLREQIHIFVRLKVVLLALPAGHKIYPQELGLMSILREWKPDLYDRFVSGKADPKEYIDALENTSADDSIFSDSLGWILEGFLLSSAADVGKASSLLETYEKLAAAVEGGAPMNGRESKALEIYSWCQERRSYGENKETNLPATAARIGFSDSFLSKGQY